MEEEEEERSTANLEQALIEQGQGSHENGDEIIQETKKQVWLAAPLIAVSMLQYSLQVISIMFVGHLGELPLSSASMATSFASVSGFSVLLSPTCKLTWTGFSAEAVHHLFSFLKLGVPSAIMICLEYWSFEMVVLLSGLLPNPKLETSVLSISLNTCWMVYMISVGLGGAISTRVSNELGAARPKGARLALLVMVSMAISEGLAVLTVTVLVRNVWGKLYSKDYEVVIYVAKMMPLLAVSNFLDGFQCVLSGAARGCGWQKACAFINLGAYYFVALPCALLFAFVFQAGGMGLWMGIICGLSVQVIALVTLNLRTDWNEEAGKAFNRIQSCSIPNIDGEQ